MTTRRNFFGLAAGVAREASPGSMQAGDAAAMLDPTSSQGVLWALMSGFLAGQTAEPCWTATMPRPERRPIAPGSMADSTTTPGRCG
jgi:hypothetical protein